MIFENLPSVLSKLENHVISKGKNIEFMINMYEVQRGTCIVLLININ